MNPMFHVKHLASFSGNVSRETFLKRKEIDVFLPDLL
jgi:hypothetical protein